MGWFREQGVRLLAALSSIAVLSSCILFDTFQSEYSAKSTTLWLVDEETGAPISGAIATGNWELVAGTLAGGPAVQGQMKIMETVSDDKGKVFFPAWGPEPNRYGGHIRADDPQIIVYKDGYKPVRLDNFNRYMRVPQPGTPLGYSLDALRHSLWDGETIKLRKATDPIKPRDIDASLSGIRVRLDFAIDGTNCDWKFLPRMAAVLLAARLIQRGYLREERCGALGAVSPKDDR